MANDKTPYINQLIASTPEYRDMHPDLVAEQLYEKHKGTWGDDKSSFYKEFLEYSEPGFFREAGKAIKRTPAEIKNSMANAAPAAFYQGLDNVADFVLGKDTKFFEQKSAENLAEFYETHEKLQKLYPSSVESFREIDGLKTALQFTGAAAPEALGTMLSFLSPATVAGGGALLLSKATPVVTKKLTKDAIKKNALKAGKELTDDKVDDIANRLMANKTGIFSGNMKSGTAFKKGFGTGFMGAAYMAETGESYSSLFSEGVDAPFTAMTAGAIKSGLEFYTPYMAFKRVFKGDKALEKAFSDKLTTRLLQRMGAEVPRTMVSEGLTESMQQTVDVLANEFVNENAGDLLSQENIDSIINAGLAGAIGGGVFGAGVGAVQEITLPEINNVKARKEEQFESTDLPEDAFVEDEDVAPLESRVSPALEPTPQREINETLDKANKGILSDEFGETSDETEVTIPTGDTIPYEPITLNEALSLKQQEKEQEKIQRKSLNAEVDDFLGAFNITMPERTEMNTEELIELSEVEAVPDINEIDPKIAIVEQTIEEELAELERMETEGTYKTTDKDGVEVFRPIDTQMGQTVLEETKEKIETLERNLEKAKQRATKQQMELGLNLAPSTKLLETPVPSQLGTLDVKTKGGRKVSFVEPLTKALWIVSGKDKTSSRYKAAKKYLDDAEIPQAEAYGKSMRKTINKMIDKDPDLKSIQAQAPADLKERLGLADFQVAPEQDITKNKAFKKWFGKSKVVDQDGKPLVVYHGTTGDIIEFKHKEKEVFDKYDGQDLSWYGKGFYFHSSPNIASDYAKMRADKFKESGQNVMPVYISLQNPLVIEDADNLTGFDNALRKLVSENISKKDNKDIDFLRELQQSPEKTREFLESLGYDGVMLQDSRTGKIGEVIAYKPTQIKSTSNKGTFDPSDPRISFQITPDGRKIPIRNKLWEAVNKLQDKATGEQYLKTLRNSGIPKELFEFSGLVEYLEERGKDKMTKQEIIDILTYQVGLNIKVKDVPLEVKDWREYNLTNIIPENMEDYGHKVVNMEGTHIPVFNNSHSRMHNGPDKYSANAVSFWTKYKDIINNVATYFVQQVQSDHHQLAQQKDPATGKRLGYKERNKLSVQERADIGKDILDKHNKVSKGDPEFNKFREMARTNRIIPRFAKDVVFYIDPDNSFIKYVSYMNREEKDNTTFVSVSFLGHDFAFSPMKDTMDYLTFMYEAESEYMEPSDIESYFKLLGSLRNEAYIEEKIFGSIYDSLLREFMLQSPQRQQLLNSRNPIDRTTKNQLKAQFLNFIETYPFTDTDTLVRYSDALRYMTRPEAGLLFHNMNKDRILEAVFDIHEQIFDDLEIHQGIWFSRILDAVKGFNRATNEYTVKSEIEAANMKRAYLMIEEDIRYEKDIRDNRMDDIPFKRNWAKLTVKKAIQDAIEKGYRQIAFPKGDAAIKIQRHETRTQEKKDAMHYFYGTQLSSILQKIAKKYGFVYETATLPVSNKDIGKQLEGFIYSNTDDMYQDEKDFFQSIEADLDTIIYSLKMTGDPTYVGEEITLDEAIDAIKDLGWNKINEFNPVREYEISVLKFPEKAVEELFEKGDSDFQFDPNSVNPEDTRHQNVEQIVDNLKGVPLKDPAKYTRIMNDLTKRLGKMLNKNIPEIQFFDQMWGYDNKRHRWRSVRGAQWGNTIYVSLNFNTRNNYSNTDTAFHEAFHFIYKNLLDDADRALLEREVPRMIEYIRKEFPDLVPFDLENLGAEEIAATAFGYWSDRKLKDTASNAGMINRVFKKIFDIFRAIRDAFRKENVNSFEDLFESTMKGRYAKNALQKIMEENRLARFQEAVANVRSNYFENASKQEQLKVFTPKQFNQSFPEEMWEGMEQSMTQLQNGITKFLNTNFGLANEIPEYAPFYQLLDHYQKSQSYIDDMIIDNIHELLNPKNRQRLVNATAILDDLNARRIPLQYMKNNPSRLVYKDPSTNKWVALTEQASKDVAGLQTAFNTVLQLWTDTLNSKLKDIEGFDHIEDAIKAANKEIAEVINVRHQEDALMKAERRLDKFANIKEVLRQLQDLKDDPVPYYPRLATGEWGVKLINKKNSKEEVPQGFAIIGSDPITRDFDKKELELVKKRWKDELGYDMKDYKIAGGKPFRLKKNEILKQLNQNGIKTNLELMLSLVSSVDHDFADGIQKTVEDLFGGIRTFKINPNFVERNNSLLYSRDYAKVIPTYFATATRAVNRYRYSDAIGAAQDFLENGEMWVPAGEDEASRGKRVRITDTDKLKLMKEQFDYSVSPQNDQSELRMLNFFYALGGNVSTGLLQLMTLPIQVNATMNIMGGNAARNLGIISKNLAKVADLMAKAKFDTYKFGEIKFLEQHFDEETANALQMAHDLGQFAPSRAEDMVGQERFTSGKLTNGYTDWVSDMWNERGKKALAFPVQKAEEISRIAAFLSLRERLTSQNGLQNIESNLLNNEALYRTKKRRFVDIEGMDENTHAAMYLIDSTHGVFGKLGRGKNQQGVWGSLVFPFMQHPLMMMGLFVRMAKGGAMSKQAAAYTILATMMLAGLYGIPGWELWKEMIEKFYKMSSGGREIDLHHELKKVLADLSGSPRLAEGLTEGTLRTLGIDVGRRIGQPIFFQDALIPILQGQDSIDNFAGVTGSIIRNATGTMKQMGMGEMGGIEGTFNMLAPIAAKNLFKASILYPQEGIRTGSGTQIMTPEEWSPMHALLKSFGIQPSQLAREYEKRNAERLGAFGYRQGKNKLVNKIAIATAKMVEARKEGDSENYVIYKQEVKDLYKKLYAFSKKSGETLDGSWRSGVKRSVNNHLANAKNPDIPVRTYKTVDQDLLNYLYEEDDD
jgi:hypothetical protein